MKLKNTFHFPTFILVLYGVKAPMSLAITSQRGVSISSGEIDYGDLIAADDNLYFGELDKSNHERYLRIKN